LVATATSLEKLTSDRSSTASQPPFYHLCKLGKIGPVDVQVIDLTLPLKIKKEPRAFYKPIFGCAPGALMTV